MNNTDIDTDLVPSQKIQFWTYLSLEIPSLACIIYLLYHFLCKRRFRQGLHNHVIIILLFLCFLVEIIDNPLYLDAYLHNGRNSFIPSPIICLIWWLLDYGVYSSLNLFLAWASFERNMLIFYHNRFFSTRRKKFIFHYLPLGIISIYSIIFYISVMVFPPCENIFNYESYSCGSSPCYTEIAWISDWDTLINQMMFILIEVAFNVCLLVRTIYQRYRVQRSVHWRKHRKMTIQLLSISFLSLSISLPISLFTVIQNTIPGLAHFSEQASLYFYFMGPFVVLLLPLICLASTPDLWPKRWICIKQRRQQTVFPTQMLTARPLSEAVPK
jgi:hypothetical protein